MNRWVATFSSRHGLGDQAIRELEDWVETSGGVAPMSGVAESMFGPASTLDDHESGFVDLTPLGKGAVGEVFRGLETRLQRTVALKVLRDDRAGDPGAVGRFVEEGRILARLQHPGIPPVYDAGVLPDGRPYVSMLEVRGRTLRQAAIDHHSGRSPIPLRRRVTWVLRLAEAVAYAHDQGIVHRDIKPSNAMISDRGAVYALDWGLAFDTRTAVGQHRVGTPAFLAPEVLDGAGHTPQSDVYGLGLVLLGLIHSPFVQGVQADERSRVPVAVGAMGTPLLSQVLAAALADQAGDRWAHAGAFAEALAGWLDGSDRRKRADSLLDDAQAIERAAAAVFTRIETVVSQVSVLRKSTRDWQPVDEKKPLWSAQTHLQSLQSEASELIRKRLGVLASVLALVPEHDRALNALAAHHQQAYGPAHAAGQIDVAAEHLARVRRYDRGQRVRWLQGLARLELVTDPPNAAVSVHGYVIDGLRWVAGPGRSLGHTPLSVDLPVGRHLLVIQAPGGAAVRYPILLERDGVWRGGCNGRVHTVRLPGRRRESGAVFVPAGPFLAGEDHSGFQSFPRQTRWQEGFWIQCHPVTHGDYLVFLNDLVRQGRVDEAVFAEPQVRARGLRFYGRDEQGGYRLIPDSDGDLWDADWPVFFVDAASAEAYALWWSARSGRSWTLPSEFQLEKAARGADGRAYPWGDQFDASYASVRESHRGRPLPATIDAYPEDCSVYGVYGLAGNVRAWCSEAYGPPGGEVVARQRVLRGGCFFFPARGAHGAARFGLDRERAGDTVGFRLVSSDW